MSVSKELTLVVSKTQTVIQSAGRIKHHLEQWGKLTSDPHILNIVRGCKIEFDQPPYQWQPPSQPQFSPNKAETVDNEIAKLVLKGVLIKSSHEQGEYLSTAFLRPKKDETHRVILNLKKLNKFVSYHHFKMESLKHVVSMVRPNCFMASADLKDAYYSVPIHQDHQKFLKCEWKGQLYQFTCLPNSLTIALSENRVFSLLTTLMIPTCKELLSSNAGIVSQPLLLCLITWAFAFTQKSQL